MCNGTGDVGVHSDVYLEIKDRSKDVIISGGRECVQCRGTVGALLESGGQQGGGGWSAGRVPVRDSLCICEFEQMGFDCNPSEKEMITAL